MSQPASIPVWIVATSSPSAETSVFEAELRGSEPYIVFYQCDQSFEVVTDLARLRPRLDASPPEPWMTVAWSDIKDLCFSRDPRKLERYKGGRSPLPEDIGADANLFQSSSPLGETTREETKSPPDLHAEPEAFSSATHEEPQTSPEGPSDTPPPAKRPCVSKGEPHPFSKSFGSRPAPTSSPIELFAHYKAGTPTISAQAAEAKASIFENDSSFAEQIIKANIEVELYQPSSTMTTYKGAVSRFLEYINTAKIREQALLSPDDAEQVLLGFFSTRIGLVPPLSAALHWSTVTASTAKGEVSAIVALFRIFGLPTPSTSKLNNTFRKSGALKKPTNSKKLPLFTFALEKLWERSENKIDPINLRNLCLCVVTYFFMLRGGESRILRRNQLELIREKDGEQTWKISLDHSKSDPPALGVSTPGGSWSGFTSNRFFSSVITHYLEAFLGPSYPPHLPLFPQVDIRHVPHDPSNAFSRRAPCSPSTSWLLHPVETSSGGKMRAGHLTTSDSVNKWLKLSLKKVGIETHHTMHSLRVGSATEALYLGASISQIKRMGHWKSLAVLTYAVESLSSIEETTKLFGGKELTSLGSVVSIKERIRELLEDDEDGDVNGNGGCQEASASPPP